MARVMSTAIGFTKGTVSGARIVLYLGRNFKSVSRSILDLGPRVMEASRPRRVPSHTGTDPPDIACRLFYQLHSVATLVARRLQHTNDQSLVPTTDGPAIELFDTLVPLGGRT